MKKIKDDTSRWRNIAFSWIRRINIVKMSILPEANYRFNAIPMYMKNTNGIFQRTRKNDFNLYGNTKLRITKQSSERRMELKESTFLTSDYTTKLQSLRQYGTGTKTEM